MNRESFEDECRDSSCREDYDYDPEEYDLENPAPRDSEANGLVRVEPEGRRRRKKRRKPKGFVDTPIHLPCVKKPVALGMLMFMIGVLASLVTLGIGGFRLYEFYHRSDAAVTEADRTATPTTPEVFSDSSDATVEDPMEVWVWDSVSSEKTLYTLIEDTGANEHGGTWMNAAKDRKLCRAHRETGLCWVFMFEDGLYGATQLYPPTWIDWCVKLDGESKRDLPYTGQYEQSSTCRQKVDMGTVVQVDYLVASADPAGLKTVYLGPIPNDYVVRNLRWHRGNGQKGAIEHHKGSAKFDLEFPPGWTNMDSCTEFKIHGMPIPSCLSTVGDTENPLVIFRLGTGHQFEHAQVWVIAGTVGNTREVDPFNCYFLPEDPEGIRSPKHLDDWHFCWITQHTSTKKNGVKNITFKIEMNVKPPPGAPVSWQGNFHGAAA